VVARSGADLGSAPVQVVLNRARTASGAELEHEICRTLGRGGVTFVPTDRVSTRCGGTIVGRGPFRPDRPLTGAVHADRRSVQSSSVLPSSATGRRGHAGGSDGGDGRRDAIRHDVLEASNVGACEPRVISTK
jgi:hypothetical protein